MTPLQTLRLHLNEYERFIQRATEMEAGIREEEAGIREEEAGASISNAYWETAYEAVFGTSKDVHSALRALNTRLDYYDPDTTYEEDVRAFVDALREKVEQLEHVLGDSPLFSQNQTSY